MSTGVTKDYGDAVSVSSRYKKDTNIVNYKDTVVFDIPRTLIIPDSSSDSYAVVSNSTKNRIDLIASQEYGASKYWWIICNINNINYPFNVDVNTILRLPAITSLSTNGVI